MTDKEEFEKMVHESKKKCQEAILLVSERRPHHIFMASVADDGQVCVIKHGGNQGIEALMLLAIMTTAITQTQKNLGLVEHKPQTEHN
jgi:hypothetical protein